MKFLSRLQGAKQPGAKVVVSASAPDAGKSATSSYSQAPVSEADILLRRLLDSATKKSEIQLLLERPETATNEALLSQLASRSFNMSFVAATTPQQPDLTPPPPQMDGTARFKSRRALIVLLHLLPLLPTEIASFYVSSMHGIVQPSPANADACADARFIDFLLGWLDELATSDDEEPASQNDVSQSGAATEAADVATDDSHDTEERHALLSAVVALAPCLPNPSLLLA